MLRRKGLHPYESWLALKFDWLRDHRHSVLSQSLEWAVGTFPGCENPHASARLKREEKGPFRSGESRIPDGYVVSLFLSLNFVRNPMSTESYKQLASFSNEVPVLRLVRGVPM